MELLGKIEVNGEILEVYMPTVKDLVRNNINFEKERGIEFQVHLIAIATKQLIVEVEEWPINDFMKAFSLLSKAMEIL